jgi:hypothetical protein
MQHLNSVLCHFLTVFTLALTRQVSVCVENIRLTRWSPAFTAPPWTTTRQRTPSWQVSHLWPWRNFHVRLLGSWMFQLIMCLTELGTYVAIHLPQWNPDQGYQTPMPTYPLCWRSYQTSWRWWQWCVAVWPTNSHCAITMPDDDNQIIFLHPGSR